MSKRIVVIGSGFSGLSAACFLAKAGHDVTVVEKNDTPGGRARTYSEKGFTFDMGPSWYWMPDVFENFFKQFGKSVSDYYQLERLSPSYRVFYGDQDWMDIPAELNALYTQFESIEQGSGEKLKSFLKEAEYKYEVGVGEMVYKPGKSFTEYLDARLISGMLRLHVFKSMRNYVRSYFKNPKLISLLEFPVLFLGAKPEDTPALYSLMNYADMCLGTWYPKGGMYKIVEGMYSLATELGVKFQFNSAVEKIEVEGGVAKSIVMNKNKIHFDTLVAGADYEHVEQKLLPPESRKYTASYWDSRKLAPSCLIYYVGLNKKLKNVLHHNLFFDKDFDQHAKQIYDTAQWPDNPLFYVSCTSKTDNSVAPTGHENLFILIPVAPGLKDTPAIMEDYFNLVIKRMEKITGEQISDSIVYKKSYGPQNFVSDYNSFKGNAYGLANTLMQTGVLKPSMQNKKVKNLFYTGQLTVPGPGVPPSLISGEVVANEINKKYTNEIVIR